MMDDDEINPRLGRWAETPLQQSGVSPMPDDSPQPVSLDGVSLTPNPDGTVTVNFTDDGVDVPGHIVAKHGDNLADKLSPDQRAHLADKVLDYVEADKNSRAEWQQSIDRGKAAIGLDFIPENSSAFKNGSRVTHPLVAEAALQFAARAIGELFPSTGPAKVEAPGDAVDTKLEQRRSRVEEYLNYYLTTEDRGYRANWDQMLFILAVEGCIFRKVWRDPITAKPRSRYIRAGKLHVPFSSEDMETTPRYTHEFTYHINDVKEAMENGTWRKVDLGSPATPVNDDPGDDPTKQAGSYAEDDDIRTIYECAAHLHLFDDDRSKPQKPYLITVDSASQEVLGVYRNYAEEDGECRRLQSVIKYDLLPGFGFYGYGFLHLLGSMGAAAGGLLRAIIDAAALANLQGGFKARGAKGSGEVQIKPGEFIDVDMTAEDLAKAFFNLPFKGPEPATFQVLNLLVETGQRFATTTDVAVGDAKNTGPVGTTVALIEQAQKVFSAVHLRLHAAQMQELQLIYNLLAEMETPEYPYRVRGQSRKVMKQDFAGDLEVLPVSDPNISSSTQRLAIAQGTLQLVGTAPQLYGDHGTRVAHRRMLEAMKVRNPDELLPERPYYRLDPVSENQMLLTGKPVGAFQEQNHQAHIMLHMQLVQMVMQLPPQQQQQILPPLVAHIAEHVGYQYRVQFEMQLQGSLPDFNLYTPSDLDAMTEQRVSMAVQSVMPQINAPMQQLMAMLGGGAQQQAQQQAQQHQQEMQQQAQKHQQDMQQAQERHQQAMQVAAQRHQHELAMRESKASSEAQIKQMLAEAQNEARQILAAAEVRTKEMVAAATTHIQAVSAAMQEHLKNFQTMTDEARKTAAFNNEQARLDESHDNDQTRKEEAAAAQRKQQAAAAKAKPIAKRKKEDAS